MRVLVPGPLRSYTAGASECEVTGANLAEALEELDRRYPGFRFRIIDEQERVRTHIRIFVNARQVSDLTRALLPEDELAIVCALSGG